MVKVGDKRRHGARNMGSDKALSAFSENRTMCSLVLLVLLRLVLLLGTAAPHQ